MRQNGTEKGTPAFGWTKERERAAVLLAEDDRSDAEIAAELGISRSTLARWKEHPAFRDRLTEHTAAIKAAMRRLAIAKKHKRLAVLDDLHDRALQVIAHRAARHAPAAETPEQSARRVFGAHTPAEAATGLVVVKESAGGQGITTEWSVDTGLLREIRALEEQAARELGEWSEKVEHSGEVGIIRRYVGVDVEQV